VIHVKKQVAYIAHHLLHLVHSTRRGMAEDSDAGLNMDSALESNEVQKYTMTPFVETDRIWGKKERYLLINMSSVPHT